MAETEEQGVRHGVPSPARRLDWDSAFFGRPIAEVSGRSPGPAQLRAATAWAIAGDIQCLYFLADAEATESHRAAENLGFRLVDVRLTFERGLAPSLSAPAEGVDIRPWLSRDLALLADIARHNHDDSRFYSDPRFPRERCEALYATWIVRSCEGFADTVLVAERAGQAVGYTTCHLRPDGEGNLGLVGVHRSARGQQLGRALVEAAVTWFGAQGAQRVTVVTQGRNRGAIRFYQRLGFAMAELQLWFHWWNPALAEDDG